MKFKSKIEIDEAFIAYSKIDSTDYNEIKKKFFEIFGLLQIAIFDIDIQFIQDHFKFYRNRKATTGINRNLIEEFGSPDPQKYTSTQRCNWEGRNVFYSSDSLITSLKEIKNLEVGNEFYASEWKLEFKNVPNKKIHFASLIAQDIPDSNPWKSIIPSKEQQIQTLKNEHSEIDAQLIYYFSQKLGNFFVKTPSSQYHLTAFIADYIFTSHPKNENKQIYFPLIIFPSVENNLETCNIVFHAGFEKKYLKLQKIAKMKILEICNNKLRCSYFNEIGIGDNQNIKWISFVMDKGLFAFQIERISCECGESFPIENIDSYVIKSGTNEFSVSDFIRHWADLKYNPYDYQLDIFASNGVPCFLDIPLKINDFNHRIRINDIDHNNFTIEILLRQIITYQ